MDRKPILTGLLIALLTFKPHLGGLIPMALLVSGRWLIFTAATFGTLLFAGFSYFVLGPDTWAAFFNSMALSSRILHEGLVPYHKMQSLFAGMRLVGASIPLAYVIHGVLAIIAAVLTTWIWHQKCDHNLQFAVLATASLLISPFLLDYDLMMLAIPIVCISRYGLVHGFRPWLISLLTLLWLWPIVARAVNAAVPLPWTPILLSLLLMQMVMIVRRHHVMRKGL